MSDRYDALRALPFLTVIQALGFPTNDYKPRKGGTEFAGKCPVHRPKRNNTSFSYNVDGRFACFSCQAKGRGALDLVKAIKGCGFQDAVSFLEPLGSDIRPVEQRSPIETAPASSPLAQGAGPALSENPAKKFTYEKHFVESEWLLRYRNFLPATLEHFGVGEYNNPARQSSYKGKVLFRIQRFKDGETVGYLARDVRPPEERGDSPKYLCPSGVAKSLEVFGAWQLKARAPFRYVYLVESPLAVMRLYQLGGYPAVSTYGWHVSDQQAQIIAQLCKGVVYLPDRDKWQEAAGQAGTLARYLWTRMPELPEGVDDPEYLSIEQIKALTA